ncbi:MAG: polysaccharide biosynthesis protein [Candidatus Omnitrophica bacterium]|nr:polysaccharide biosynthesis protein [Candidatus Omnitrophota bacterium]
MTPEKKESYKAIIVKYRRPLIICVNLLLIFLSYYLSFMLRFEFLLSREYTLLFLKTLPLLLIVKFLVYYYFGLFHGLWRYVSVDDILQIIKANLVATAIFIIGDVFIYDFQNALRFIFINDFIICTAFIGGIRFLARIIREKYRNLIPIKERPKVLIVVAGEAGILLLKEYKNNPALGEVVGFIDDDKVKQNSFIYGYKVLGDRNAIARVVDTYGVEEIVLAIPSATGEVIRGLINCCRLPSIKLKIVPSISKIINGQLQVKIREVRPEDLLGRQSVTIDEDRIAEYLKNKKVLITGAAGSIGSELCRQVANFSPAEITLLDHNENNLYFLTIELKTKYKSLDIKVVIGDINDISLLKRIFSEYRPQVVFHAAAYKHVPLMEENPVAAIKNNTFGTRNIIYASHHYKVERFVLISTDKAVNPINIMGLSKRMAEILLQAKARRSKTKFMAVRFGNVLGSDGSVVPLFKKQIESGGPITITHPDATRYFMSIKEAVLLVLEAAAIGTGGEIFILDMGEQIKIVDLARDLVTLSGLELGKDIDLKCIGLRPGEKVKEEIMLDKERDKVTKHGKIYISHSDNFDVITIRKQLKELERYVNLTDKEKVVQKAKEIVRKIHVK